MAGSVFAVEQTAGPTSIGDDQQAVLGAVDDDQRERSPKIRDQRLTPSSELLRDPSSRLALVVEKLPVQDHGNTATRILAELRLRAEAQV
jgi:hypothetical protein